MCLSFPQMENLESKCSLTLGLMHDFLGLQLAHFPFLWGKTVTRRISLRFTGENPLSLSLAESVRVLFQMGSSSPIQPLQALNTFLQKYMFRMLAQVVLLYLVRANNWFMSVYSHIHSSQTISLISLSEGVVWIPCSPIRPFSQPEGLLYPTVPARTYGWPCRWSIVSC